MPTRKPAKFIWITMEEANENIDPDPGNNNPIPKAGHPDRPAFGPNPAESWKLLKQRWNIYNTLQKISDFHVKISEKIQLSGSSIYWLLAYGALAAYNGFHFDSEEYARAVDEIITKFDEYAIGEVYVTFELCTIGGYKMTVRL